MSQESLEVVKAFFEAYNARDSEAVDRLLHPEAEITTLSARRGLPDHWRHGTTEHYFEKLDEAWTHLRIEVEDYREAGERVVALGVMRGAGMASHVEVTSQFAPVAERVRPPVASAPARPHSRARTPRTPRSPRLHRR
jgi:ketosteroid isomerase-like protein